MRYAIPGKVTASAIISFMVGALLIIVWVSNGINTLFQGMFMGDSPEEFIHKHVEAVRAQEIAGYRSATIGLVLFALGQAIALLISGLGQLGMRAWSRPLAIWASGLSIVYFVFYAGFYFICVYPATRSAFASLPAELDKKGIVFPIPQFLDLVERILLVRDILVAAGSLILIIPLVIAILFLLLPSVKEAFRNPVPAGFVARIRAVAEELEDERADDGRAFHRRYGRDDRSDRDR